VVEHRSEEEDAAAHEALFLHGDRDFQAAAKAIGPGPGLPADRLGGDRADAIDLLGDLRVFVVGVEPEQVAEGDGPLPRVGISED